VLAGSSFAVALDTPAEEVKALVDVGDEGIVNLSA
jgi:hypothetical protein